LIGKYEERSITLKEITCMMNEFYRYK